MASGSSVTPIAAAHTLRTRRLLSAQTLALIAIDAELARVERERDLAFQRLIGAPQHMKAHWLERLEETMTEINGLEAKRNRVLGGVAVREVTR